MVSLPYTPRSCEFTCPNPSKGEAVGAGFHRMHYMEWGEKDAERTVVCVHGLTRNSRDFDMLACALVKQGYRVICPDIVGRGKSEWLKLPQFYGYPLYVSDMIALLYQLDEHDVHWIGTSMGGLIGMMVEAAVPHLLDKLVLNDIGSFIPKASLDRIGSYIGQKMSFDSWEAAEAYFKEVHAPFGIKAEWQWEQMLRYSFTEIEGKIVANYDPAIGMAFWNKRGKPRRMRDMDLSALWFMIHNPTLILRGSESDLLLRETMLDMAQRDYVDYHEFEGIGHAPALMDESQIKVISDWLGEATPYRAF